MINQKKESVIDDGFTTKPVGTIGLTRQREGVMAHRAAVILWR